METGLKELEDIERRLGQLWLEEMQVKLGWNNSSLSEKIMEQRSIEDQQWALLIQYMHPSKETKEVLDKMIAEKEAEIAEVKSKGTILNPDDPYVNIFPHLARYDDETTKAIWELEEQMNVPYLRRYFQEVE